MIQGANIYFVTHSTQSIFFYMKACLWWEPVNFISDNKSPILMHYAAKKSHDVQTTQVRLPKVSFSSKPSLIIPIVLYIVLFITFEPFSLFLYILDKTNQAKQLHHLQRCGEQVPWSRQLSWLPDRWHAASPGQRRPGWWAYVGRITALNGRGGPRWVQLMWNRWWRLASRWLCSRPIGEHTLFR